MKIIREYVADIDMSLGGLTEEEVMAYFCNAFGAAANRGYTNVRIQTQSRYDASDDYQLWGDRFETEEEKYTRLRRRKASKESAAKARLKRIERVRKEAKKLGII